MKNMIGPFLGPRGNSGISINIGLPGYEKSELTCQLFHSGQIVEEKTVKPQYDFFQLFQFEFSSLDAEKTYTYKFFHKNDKGHTTELDLAPGLTYDDCQFKVLGNSKESSFIVLSCNNPFATEEGSADHGWAMWQQLATHIKEDDSVRLIVLAGDQVYNDDIEKEFLAKASAHKESDQKQHSLSKGTDDQLKNRLKSRFISQYQKYWGHESYRKIFASIPSIAMWDDHDITDGWGSRPESFPKTQTEKPYYFKEDWWQFFKVAKEAFAAYQASRNSNKIAKVADELFSSYLDWEENRFILCDFRSERNSKKNILWSNEHKNAVLQFIKESPKKIKRVFFVTPVVALRTNFQGDKRIGKVARILFQFKSYINKNNPWYILKSWKWLLLSLVLLLLPMAVSLLGFLPTGISTLLYIIFAVLSPTAGLLLLLWFGFSWGISLLGKIPELPELSDDIEDGLSSDSNIESLKEILDVLTTLLKENNKEVYILSGDIHLGGLTEIIDTRSNEQLSEQPSILQIVSSPIAYKPMPKVVAGLTTTTSEMVLRESTVGKRLFARNIFYISKRNFVQIIPDKMADGKGIRFFLEGHQLPIVFPKKFWA